MDSIKQEITNGMKETHLLDNSFGSRISAELNKRKMEQTKIIFLKIVCISEINHKDIKLYRLNQNKLLV